jgi:hypothetical protein
MLVLLALIATLVSIPCALVCPATSLPPVAAAAAALTMDQPAAARCSQLHRWWPRIKFVLCL